MSVMGLVKINSSTSEDGLDYEELRTVTGLQQLDQVIGEPLQQLNHRYISIEFFDVLSVTGTPARSGDLRGSSRLILPR